MKRKKRFLKKRRRGRGYLLNPHLKGKQCYRFKLYVVESLHEEKSERKEIKLKIDYRKAFIIAISNSTDLFSFRRRQQVFERLQTEKKEDKYVRIKALIRHALKCIPVRE